ncbi:hypothetical protein C8F04DRAFT_966920 [Mycena alexandri]|uniref:CxC2-like cysteine cluster KDZ transposase-associated domain-containing protein n=1 Tax=Mycena alexandri TaxID=1745969 RepID=A0AAD6SDR1_9AGAR|nr:hypothetical protein C8F04DRAFT_966920 [Mycena alexandri]
MSEFPEVQQLFSDELLRRAGLGDWTRHQACAICECPLAASAATFTPCYRCGDCGQFLQCRDCCVQRHQTMPLHFLEVWGGRFWKKTTLRALGLVYQLGHGGFRCRFPEATVRTLVVVHESGIHKISYTFCACSTSKHANNLCQFLRNDWYPASKTDPDTVATFSVLDLYRLMNVGGNLNAYDFIAALERKTDADRYKAFLRMSRQWAFLARVRRAGMGHNAGGLAETGPGECLVKCWPCPHKHRNIPENFRDVDPKFRFIYRLILALDANFKLKNRIRTNEHWDPSLGPGWGAFVEPVAYRKHLRKHVAEKDISTCIAFAALMQKDTRNTTGLRVSGVGGCVCARHECMRPNGLGDLQKGERYANMDFVLMSALQGFDLDELTISYDIACQWHKNLAGRIERLPKPLQLALDKIFVKCGLPVWHASAHNKACANEFSLSFLPGVGRSDGEGVERLWADLNPSAFHTKEMGLGNRADTLEDKIDAHNFLKNLGCVDILRRKLVVALAERDVQVASFKEINKTILPEVREDWQLRIDNWLKDRSGSNPYVLSGHDGPSEADIRLQLRKEEEADAGTGKSPLHGTSATAFLAAGLQLEAAQRRIKAELAGDTLTVDREGKVNEHRLSFMSKLNRYRNLQRVYTPGAIRALQGEEAERDEDTAPPKAEDVSLFLPSALSSAERVSGCQAGLPDMEARLREAQCGDALATVRSLLHSKGHLIIFRNEHVTGQVGSTRSQTLIARVGGRVTQHHKKYSQARRALHVLKGNDYAPHLKKMRQSDLTLAGEEKESDSSARAKLARLGAGKHGRQSRNAPSENKTLSWIWSAPGALDKEEESLHESLRVEWSRAKARKTRWEEEVMLLREEMRRVVRYLRWQAEDWGKKGDVTVSMDDISAPTQLGKVAYAAKQAALYDELADFYKQQLSMSAEETIGSVVASEEDDINLVSLFSRGMFFFVLKQGALILQCRGRALMAFHLTGVNCPFD